MKRLEQGAPEEVLAHWQEAINSTEAKLRLHKGQ